MSGKSTGAIILAAGKGTRMKSDLPKVLHPLLGRPLLWHVLALVESLGVQETVAVIGHGRERVERFLKGYGVKWAVQEEQLGTGHAVSCGLGALSDSVEDILILCGDTPLFKFETLDALIKAHEGHGSDISVLSALFSDPTGYGRIVRDAAGRLRAIVEQKDGDDETLSIREINSGTYLVKAEALRELLPLIENNNAQGEYYLTDIVALGLQKGLSVEAFPLAEEDETLGVNSRFQLSQAEAVLLKRLRRRLMDSGVTLVMADTIYLEPGVAIENDVVIEPFTMICGSTSIGKGARIGAGAILKDVAIPAGMVVQPGMILTG